MSMKTSAKQIEENTLLYPLFDKSSYAGKNSSQASDACSRFRAGHHLQRIIRKNKYYNQQLCQKSGAENQKNQSYQRLNYRLVRQETL